MMEVGWPINFVESLIQDDRLRLRIGLILQGKF